MLVKGRHHVEDLQKTSSQEKTHQQKTLEKRKKLAVCIRGTRLMEEEITQHLPKWPGMGKKPAMLRGLQVGSREQEEETV